MLEHRYVNLQVADQKEAGRHKNIFAYVLGPNLVQRNSHASLSRSNYPSCIRKM